MIILQTHHFSAAHRNQELEGDKCFSLHGHTYFVEFGILARRRGDSSTSVLFADLHKVLAPIIDTLDHSLLLDVNDPWANTLQELQPKRQKIVHFPYPTSVENMAFYLFHQVVTSKGGLELAEIHLRETTSTVLCYDSKDYLEDLPILGTKKPGV